ncbi:type II toxin-antitoxin system VapC family toxin [Leptolyngbya sp. AN03gr2]|uniref:type II toxin-antitoxin system VapC family toxin n=1 Tax=unclassified Leptolyngbya TaxID=2650499 RepID=UPI003D31D233
MTLRILDTDHISLTLRGHAQVINRLQSFNSQEWAATIISIQEIFNGWIVSLNDPKYQDRQVELYTRLWHSNQFFQKAQVLNFDQSAQDQYDQMRLRYPELKKRRLEKDMKIAAIAQVNQAIIVTRNQRDFALVPGLQLENWSL